MANNKVISPPNKSRKRRFYKRKGFWLGLFCLGILCAIAGWFVFLEFTRPYRDRAETYNLDHINDLERPSLILDRNGKEIGRIFVENRSVIPISDIPENLINSLRAQEDSRFLKHKGVDYIGITRAAWELLKARAKSHKINQGASTITQQLARNAYYLNVEAKRRGESDWQRKIVEAFLALRIEQRYNKRQILEYYLNRIYFGSGYYGIRSAALGYFGKEPKDLTTEECASIVGLIKNPNNLTPLKFPEDNRKWRNHVLDRMHEEGMLSAKESERLQALPVKLNPKPLQRGTSHLYERVADEIRRNLGEDGLSAGGFRVHTTILAEAQQAAQKALTESLAKAESRPGYANPKHADYHKSGTTSAPEYLQGAVLMIDHSTGEVLAYVGGRDYAQASYDFIDQGRRPLGTAFFPFLYAAGLSSGLTPTTMVDDEPMDNRAVMVGGREGILGEWGMERANPKYEGKITARRALEASKIAATVRFGSQAGLQKVVDCGKKFGLPMAQAELLPRLCVGWEQASLREAVRGISAFAQGGEMAPANLVYVDRVEDENGHPVYERDRSQASAVRATDPATAFQIHTMLAASLVRGTAAGAAGQMLEQPFSGGGKTGTSFDFSDTWFLGYNERVSCGVWAGFLQGGDPIYEGAFSRDIAMPVWIATMNAAAPYFSGKPLDVPASVVEVQVCKTSGQRATQYCHEMEADPATHAMRSHSTAYPEFFRRGTESMPFCPLHSGGDIASNGSGNVGDLPPLSVIPIRPKAPVLIGDDPYHSEQPELAPSGSPMGGFVRKRTNVLDSLDLDSTEEDIPLRAAKRLDIDPE
jgi:penicillin-binding protein 1A